MGGSENGGIERYKKESIRWFLVHVARKYMDMNICLKMLHMNLYSWKPYRDEKVWKMWGENIKLVDFGGKLDTV